MTNDLRVFAGWGKYTRIWPSFESAVSAHSEVFSGAMMDPDELEKLGCKVERRVGEDDEVEFRIVGPLSFAAARAIVDLVNGEGNYDEFFFRPAWPDEV